MSLRTKFLGVLTLIMTGGVCTTGVALIIQNAQHDETLLAEKQLLLVENAAFALQGNLSMAAREVTRLSSLKDIDPEDDDLDPERQLLHGAHENSVLFKTVRILDEQGRVTTEQPTPPVLPVLPGSPDAGQAPPNFADRRWFQAARKAHQPFYYTVPEKAVVPEAVAVVVPVRHAGVFEGVVEGELDLHDDTVLLPEMRHAAGIDGEFALVDHDGRILFSSSPRELAEKRFGYALRELSAGRQGARHVRDRLGDFMYAYAPLGIGSWGVVMRWPFSSLSAGMRSQVLTTAAILLAGALLVALLAVLFAAYFTRPLLTLSDVAARLARGEAGGAGRSNRRDEVGALFNAFDHLESELATRDQKIREDFEIISRLNASLEERVLARTRELQEAQAKLLDVERFAAMGKTAAAISHELRNALNGLGMCVDLVLADTPSSGASGGQGHGASGRVRAQIHYEIARLRDVTESLLTFARTPRLDRAPTDLNELVERALAVLAEALSDGNVTVDLDLAGDEDKALTIDVDAYKMQGVLINLIKNAVEAMTTRPLDLASDSAPPFDRERTLTIRTRHIESGATATTAIDILDSGPGLLPDARKHLFEPFFTTKVTGTGLGLATAKRVVEAHGGTVELRDRDDGREGSQATVVLRVATIEESAA